MVKCLTNEHDLQSILLFCSISAKTRQSKDNKNDCPWVFPIRRQSASYNCDLQFTFRQMKWRIDSSEQCSLRLENYEEENHYELFNG